MNPVLLRRLSLGLALAGVLVCWAWRRSGGQGGRPEFTLAQQATVDSFLRLEASEGEFVQREWGPELEAQRAEDRLTQFWDELNQAPWAGAVLAALPVERLHLPTGEAYLVGEAGIQMMQHSGPLRELSAEAWRRWLAVWERAGWRLAHSHWRLSAHFGARNGSPAQSRIEAVLHLHRPNPEERLQVQARMKVRWNVGETDERQPAEIWVESATVARRPGPPPFQPWLEAEIPVPRHTVFTDPLLAADLDGDGFSELLLVGAGRLWRNRAEGDQRRFVPEAFPGLPPERLFAAGLADADGDGHSELWLGGSAGLSLGRLAGNGQLVGSPELVWRAPHPLRHPQVLALGDVDGDGDLDAWLAQYKLPYQGGQFPTPWFDANDGFASYLLRNEGAGRFADGTVPAGLAPKARRRTYGAAFIDADGDGDLDLVNVSDFAGADVFLNDGAGRFRDVTAPLGEARHAFGMALAFNDVNGDAWPDLLMLGMDSPVAERLNALGLDRPLPGRGAAGLAQRAAMIYGNRLLLGGRDGFRGASPGVADAWRRTGWTWGCAWKDFNNDGHPDLAVANGHETLASTRDYERQFWLHDCFVAGSTNAAVPELFFRNAAGRRQAEQASYGGWQANQFLLSGVAATGPWDVAWLLGVAETADCRNLVAEDFDGDGRLDLAFTTFELYPAKRQRLFVYRNALPTQGRNWLGLQLASADLGARVEVQTTGRRRVGWLVAGDSFRSQHPFRLHFGLGPDQPTRVEVFRPNGGGMLLTNPLANAWQRLP